MKYWPEPNVRIAEGSCPEICDKEVSQDIQAVINFEVYEKTKSYVVLKVTGVHLLSSKRRF